MVILAPYLDEINFQLNLFSSNPAPGYFNDDDTLDFMVHWSGGAWPYYNFTEVAFYVGENVDNKRPLC